MGAPLESDDDDEPVAQINVVPFVDIALVLLIIFLLTSDVISRAAFKVDLPAAASAGQAVSSTVNIVVAAGGELYLDGALVSAGGLREAVLKIARGDPGLRAVIAADRQTRYAALVAIIDTVKQAGVGAFALNVEKAPAP
jgi:biopolymer transport protein ExbD